MRRTGTTDLGVGYQGEALDKDTGLIYLRARWYNPDLGRFMEMDTDEGNQEDPRSLNKYAAFDDNGVDNSDPSGNYIPNRGSAVFTINDASTGVFRTVLEGVNEKLADSSDVNSTEGNIRRLIGYFNEVSVDSGIPTKVLGSLAWSESPNGSLGYWDRNAGPANGIMQLTNSKFKGADDLTNITEGARILSENKAIEEASKPRGWVNINHQKHILTPEQKNNEWDLSVWLYKGRDTGNTHDWLVNIYPRWPVATGAQSTREPLISLWNKYANP